MNERIGTDGNGGGGGDDGDNYQAARVTLTLCITQKLTFYDVSI